MSKKRRSINYHSDLAIEDLEDEDDFVYGSETGKENEPEESFSETDSPASGLEGESGEDRSGSGSENESEDESNDDDDEDDDSDDEDQESSSEDEDEMTLRFLSDPSGGKQKATGEDDASQSPSDQQSECPICLAEFNGQMVGNPDNCRHFFCVVCIKEWAKTVNSCPIDRIKFNILSIRRSINGALLEEFYVDDINPTDDNGQFDDPTFCQVCNQCDREDRLLLCDECDQGYHLECLTPPLDSVPIDDWYCCGCAQNRSNDGRFGMEETVIPSPNAPRRGRARGARTAGVAARAARARRALLASGNLGPDIASLMDYPPRGAFVGRRKRKRRSTSRKSKSKTGAKKRDGSGVRKTKVKRRRKTKGKGRRKSKRVKKKTGETDENADICKRSAAERRTLGSASLEATLSFNLFGNKYDLDAFEEPLQEEQPKKPDNKRPLTSDPDILGGIFQGFGTLDSDNVVVKRDGTLIRKKRRKATRLDSESEAEEPQLNDAQDRKNNSKVDSDLSNSDNKDANLSNSDGAKGKEMANNSNGALKSTRSSSNKFDGPGACIKREFNSGINSPDHSANAVDISSWRTAVKSEIHSYRPLPSVEKFKSIKIPKIKKEEPSAAGVAGSSSDARVNRGDNKPRLSTRNNVKKGSRPRFVTFSCGGASSVAASNVINNKGCKLPGREENAENTSSCFNNTPIPSLDQLSDFRIPRRPKSNSEVCRVEGSLSKEPESVPASTVVRKRPNSNRSSASVKKMKPDFDEKIATETFAENTLVPTKELLNDFRIPKVPKTEAKLSTSNCNEKEFASSFKIKAEPSETNKQDNPTQNTGRVSFCSSVPKTQSGQPVARPVVSDCVLVKDPGRQVRRNIGLINMIRQQKCSLKQKVDQTSTVAVRDIGAETEAAYPGCNSPASKRDQSSTSSTLSVSDSRVLRAKSVAIETNPSHHKINFESERKDSKQGLSLFGQPMASTSSKPIAMVSPCLRAVSKIHGDLKAPKQNDEVDVKKGEKNNVVAKLQRTFLAEHESKHALKPYFKIGAIDKSEYKDILKKAVEKITSSQRTITTERVQGLIGKYVDIVRGNQSLAQKNGSKK